MANRIDENSVYHPASEQVRTQLGPFHQKQYENHVSEGEKEAIGPAALAGLGVAYGATMVRDELDERKSERLLEDARRFETESFQKSMEAKNALMTPGEVGSYNQLLDESDELYDGMRGALEEAGRLARPVNPTFKEQILRVGKRGGAAGIAAGTATLAASGVYNGLKSHHEAMDGLGVDKSSLRSGLKDEGHAGLLASAAGIGGLAGAATGGWLYPKLLKSNRLSSEIGGASLGSLFGSGLGYGAAEMGVQAKDPHDEGRLRLAQAGERLMEKRASLFGLLGTGLAMHVAPNLAMKAVKSTERGHKLLTNTFAAGVNHGKTGMKLHPNLNAIATYGIGPESMVEYGLGRKVGKKLASYGPEGSEYYMNVLKRNAQQRFDNATPEMQEQLMKTPLVGSLKRYLDGHGEGKVNDFLTRHGVPESQGLTEMQGVANAAILTGMAAVDPHLLMQPAISYGRKAVGESKLGRNFMKKQFENGKNGVPLGKTKEMMTDYLVSPGALDPYRIGKHYGTIDPKARNIAEPVIKDAHQNYKSTGKAMLTNQQIGNHLMANVPIEVNQAVANYVNR